MTLPSHHIPPRPFAGTESTLLDAGPHEPQVQPTTARSIRAVHMPECSLICPPGDSPRPATIYTPAAARPAAWQRALVMPPAPTRSPASARQPASQPAACLRCSPRPGRSVATCQRLSLSLAPRVNSALPFAMSFFLPLSLSRMSRARRATYAPNSLAFSAGWPSVARLSEPDSYQGIVKLTQAS